MRNLLRRFFRNAKGNVVGEMAIVITLLLVLVFGIVDIGRVLYTQAGLTAASREGARWGAAKVTLTPCSAVLQDTVKQKVIAAFTPFGGAAITTGQITIVPATGAACPTQTTLTVTVAY